MKVPIKTKIITITKVEKGRVFDGLESWPQTHFDNPKIGDKFEITMQASLIKNVTTFGPF